MLRSVYVKMRAGECLLLAVLSVSLSYLCLEGFDAGDPLTGSALPGVLAAAMTVGLCATASSKRALLPGSAALAAAACAVLVAAALMTAVPLTSDEPGNLVIVAAVSLLCPLVCFGLARSLPTTALLLAASIFAVGWVQFFYVPDKLLCSLAAVVAAIALVAYKNFLRSVRGAQSARNVSFKAGLAVACGVSLLAVLAGVLVWFAVIAPLDPSTLQVKLVTETRAYETVEARGTSQEYLTPNMELSSSQTNELSRTTDDLHLDPNGMEMPAKAKESPEEQEEENLGSYAFQSLKNLVDLKQNRMAGTSLLIALLVLLLGGAAYFLGRRKWRAVRLRKFQELPSAQQASAIYLFVVSKLGRLGFAVPSGVTLLEYARSNEESLRYFNEAAGGSFMGITQAYVAATYGGKQVSSEALQQLANYYNGLWKGARSQLGNLKYFFKSFRLG